MSFAAEESQIAHHSLKVRGCLFQQELALGYLAIWDIWKRSRTRKLLVMAVIAISLDRFHDSLDVKRHFEALLELCFINPYICRLCYSVLNDFELA